MIVDLAETSTLQLYLLTGTYMYTLQELQKFWTVLKISESSVYQKFRLLDQIQQMSELYQLLSKLYQFYGNFISLYQNLLIQLV